MNANYSSGNTERTRRVAFRGAHGVVATGEFPKSQLQMYENVENYISRYQFDVAPHCDNSGSGGSQQPLMARNASVNGTLNVLKIVYPFLDVHDLGSGPCGANCALLCIAKALRPAESNLDSLASALRAKLVTLLELDDGGVFPVLRDFLCDESAQQHSTEYIFESLRSSMTDRRNELTERASADESRRAIADALVFDECAQRELSFIERDDVLGWRRFVLSETDVTCWPRWVDHSEWLLFAAYFKRPIVLLQAVASNSHSSTGAFVALHRPVVTRVPEAAVLRRDLTANTPIFVGFVSSEAGGLCNHYVYVSENGAFDEVAYERDLQAQLASEVTRSNSVHTELETAPEAACRPPFAVEAPAGSFADVSAVQLAVCSMMKVRSVSIWLQSARARCITYICFHSKANSPGATGKCPFRLVFRKNKGSDVFTVDVEASCLTHHCPVVIAARPLKKEAVVNALLQSGQLYARNTDVYNFILAKYSLSINDTMASRARAEYMQRRFFPHGEAAPYARLRPFLDAVKVAVGDNFSFHIDTDDDGHLSRVFFTFAYSKTLMRHAPRLLAVDGCHHAFDDNRKAHWLMLTTLLATGNTLPVAAAFAYGAECTSSVTYFLQQCKAAELFTSGTDDVAIVSDRSPSIASALTAELPNAYTFACSRHVGHNAKCHAKVYYRELDTFVEQLSRAKSLGEYEAVERNLKAAHQQRSVLPESVSEAQISAFLGYLRDDARWKSDWTMCAVGGSARCRFGVTKSNIAESINSSIHSARCRPLPHAVQAILDQMHNRYLSLRRRYFDELRALAVSMHIDNVVNDDGEVHRELADLLVRGSSFEERYHEQEKAHEAHASTVTDVNDDAGVYACVRTSQGAAITGFSSRRVVKMGDDVPLFERCTCRVPFLYGIPCKHIIAVCCSVRSVTETTRPRYNVNSYNHVALRVRSAWKSLNEAADSCAKAFVDFNHIDSARCDPERVCKPPPVVQAEKRGRGRPKKRFRSDDNVTRVSLGRHPSNGESKGTVRCSVCHEVAGHNARTCPRRAKKVDDGADVV